MNLDIRQASILILEKILYVLNTFFDIFFSFLVLFLFSAGFVLKNYNKSEKAIEGLLISSKGKICIIV